MKYTFSDEEGDSDSEHTRRSTRHSGTSTPAELAGPTFTASGRQVRSRMGGAYGEYLASGHHNGLLPNAEMPKEGRSGEAQQLSSGRSQRSGLRNGVSRQAHPDRYKSLGSYDGVDDDSDAPSSGEEWNGGGDDDGDIEDEQLPEADDEEDLDMSDDDIGPAEASGIKEDGSQGRGSLVVSLRYQRKPGQSSQSETPDPQGFRHPDIGHDHSSSIMNSFQGQQALTKQASPLRPTSIVSDLQDQKQAAASPVSAFNGDTAVTNERPKASDQINRDWSMVDAAPHL